jgi:bacillithiol system protein YtxJ
LDLLRDLTEETALAEAMVAAVAVLYKHSHRCPTSLMAIREVRSFADRRPDVPVYVVNVVRSKDMSQQLASDLDVPHKSPQVILLNSGQPKAHASHYEITEDLLDSWVS